MTASSCPPWCDTDNHAPHDDVCVSTGGELTITTASALLDSSGVFLPTIRVYAMAPHDGQAVSVEVVTDTETGDLVLSLSPADALALAVHLNTAADEAANKQAT